MTKGRLEPPPDAFVRPLLELRDYYAQIVEEYERLYTQARSQLNHVEALLSTWSASDTNHQLTAQDITHELATLPEDRRLSLPPQEHKGISLSSDDISDIDLESFESELEESDDLESDNSSSAATQTNNNQSATTSGESHNNLIKGADVPMLREFASLSRMEAIKKLLEEYIGTVCHIDFIVRSLYGDLHPHIFKVVKGRVQSSLTQGRERNAWYAIPDEPGCYTLDLGLLRPGNNNSAFKSAKSKKKKPLMLPKTRIIPMLREYDGQFLIDAISSLLETNSGKAFTVAEVISGLYGALDVEEVREVKSKVLNELSRGYRTGRFSRVPDKIGVYTWDANLILGKISG